MGYRRSVSQLSGFTRCGEAYRLQRFTKDLPRRPAAWLAVGSAMHSAYELWENTNRTLDLGEQFSVDYITEVNAMKVEQPDLGWWMKAPNMGKAGESNEDTVARDIEIRGKEGKRAAEAYQTHCLNSGWKVARDEDDNPLIEVKFSMMLGDVEVIGAIDSILEWPDGRLSIRDLKTGNVSDAVDGRQLGTYRMAVHKVLGLELIWGEYFYTKTGKSGGMIDLRRYTEEYLTDQYGAVDKAINQKLFMANPGKNCGLCGYKPWCREMGNVDVEDDSDVE